MSDNNLQLISCSSAVSKASFKFTRYFHRASFRRFDFVLAPENQSRYSCYFPTENSEDGIKFKLELVVHPGASGLNKQLRLYLRCAGVRPSSSQRLVSYRFFLRSDEGREFARDLKPSSYVEPVTGRRLQQGSYSSVPYYLLREYCTGGYLFTRCEVTVLQFVKPTDQESSLLHDLRNQFLNPKNSDVLLKVGDEEIPAHKFVLASRSSVFEAMFDEGTEENGNNSVEIADVEPRVMKEFLFFLYTDECPNLRKLGGQLLPLAVKYAVNRLAEMVEAQLMKSIDSWNVIDVLIVSHLHSKLELKTVAMDYLAENIRYVPKKHFEALKKCPLLAKEVDDLIEELKKVTSG